MSKTAVIAVGGNSLIKDNKRISMADQLEAVKETCFYVAKMVEKGWNVVMTHGNGPQVGFLLRRAEIAAKDLPIIPLDIIGADTQGAIGYMIQQSLRNEFQKRNIDRQVATVVSQVRVDAQDAAFQKPSKPIGSFMTQEEALRNQKENGWNVVEDAGRGWRRVVASPLPQEIVEKDAIKTLIDHGFIVVAVGGGGIPVVQEGEDLKGVAAVIDKDYASSLLANSIGADLFMISTAVEKVSLNYGKENQIDLDVMTLAQAKQYAAEGHFAAGSMGPKINAVIRYLEAGGKEALITCPGKIEEALEGKNGTRIIR
ncbi:carbamate kinase [Candidatus Formimonas warabiya]|uniref:Carbamate kinase n=1 Tax=Formimonas warabiya TaxID=1761012 RepID=A0A3G1KRX8_FORW1|nr:carbamate kinase [Candidatus Formimonas warabiya]ATW24885.1 carbamate kinase [Candidatus Formimonas warabiya]